jgi:cytochrome c oxidase assembly factor 2
MPPHMHPRSRMTASLFTTTLMVSFLVVAAPHLIPCPVDPRTLNDSADPTRRRRRRKPVEAQEGESQDGDALEQQRRMMLEERMNPKRECPIPKPGGLVGQVLGMTRGTGGRDYTAG